MTPKYTTWSLLLWSAAAFSFGLASPACLDDLLPEAGACRDRITREMMSMNVSDGLNFV